MNKFLIAVFAVVFVFGSAATLASGNLSSTLPFVSAQDVLNQMACEDKDDGEKIKDRTDGKMVTCPAKIKRPKK